MLILFEWVLIFAFLGAFFVGLYLLVRHFHRKWYWEDENRKATMLQDAMKEAGIGYEVNPGGSVRPLGQPSPRTSGRAR